MSQIVVSSFESHLKLPHLMGLKIFPHGVRYTYITYMMCTVAFAPLKSFSDGNFVPLRREVTKKRTHSEHLEEGEKENIPA